MDFNRLITGFRSLLVDEILSTVILIHCLKTARKLLILFTREKVRYTARSFGWVEDSANDTLQRSQPVTLTLSLLRGPTQRLVDLMERK